MYNVIALIGEAGSGKDTIMQNILKHYNGFNEIISCTTRPIREGEVEGVNYYYYSDETFLSKVKNNEMLEATNFNGWYYGTSYDSLRSDCPNIGVFNPDGIRAMIESPDVNVIVFKIVCSNKTRLLRQLNREDHPNVDEIVRRYEADKQDFSHLDFYYIEIKNNDKEDLELATQAIMSQLGLSSN